MVVHVITLVRRKVACAKLPECFAQTTVAVVPECFADDCSCGSCKKPCKSKVLCVRLTKFTMFGKAKC